MALGVWEELLANFMYLQLENNNIGNIKAISFEEYRKVRGNAAHAKLT